MKTFLIQIVHNGTNTVVHKKQIVCSACYAAEKANEICKKFIDCSWRIIEL